MMMETKIGWCALKMGKGPQAKKNTGGPPETENGKGRDSLLKASRGNQAF